MRTLVIAPHADDEVLGLGGTISRLTSLGGEVVLAVLTGHGDAQHPLWDKSVWDNIRQECMVASAILGVSEVIFENLPAACLDVTPSWKIIQLISQLVQNFQPEVIYTPFMFDMHKDHSSISYGLHVASRPYLASSSCVKKVLAYETLSETHVVPPYPHFSFQPNVFVNIEQHIDTKLSAMKAYSSQLQPDGMPRSLSSIRALATLRGSMIGSQAAEAFMLMGDYTR